MVDLNAALRDRPLPRTGVDLSIALPIVLAHLIALAAPWFFTWHAFFGFILMYLVSGFGVTAGAHRYFTHKSFKLPVIMQGLFCLMFTLAAQGGIKRWVRDHNIHHAFADTATDPHSPHHEAGFWHAQLLWLWKMPVDRVENRRLYERFGGAVQHLPLVGWLSSVKVLLLVHISVILACYIIGCWLEGGCSIAALQDHWRSGAAMVVWAVFLRIICVLHATSLVNSAAHLRGYRSYQTHEGSRNNGLVAFLSLGEGWHNNHHSKPYAANQGFHRWWEFDLSFLLLLALGCLGLLSDLKVYRPRLNKTEIWFASKRKP